MCRDDFLHFNFAGAHVYLAERRLGDETESDVHVATGPERLRLRRPVFVLSDRFLQWTIRELLRNVPGRNIVSTDWWKTQLTTFRLMADDLASN